jgi:hypothetical protein
MSVDSVEGSLVEDALCDIARSGADPAMIRFYRQYMQQIKELNYPPGVLLINPDVQDCLHKYFFDEAVTLYLPPAQYQARVLRRLISNIEKACNDPDEDVGNQHVLMVVARG